MTSSQSEQDSDENDDEENDDENGVVHDGDSAGDTTGADYDASDDEAETEDEDEDNEDFNIAPVVMASIHEDRIMGDFSRLDGQKVSMEASRANGRQTNKEVHVKEFLEKTRIA